MIKKTLIALVASTAFAGPALADAHMAKEMDIVETATEAGTFETLVAAVQAAALVDVLSGEGPFTVFAPTDDAFAALPAGTVEDLLKPENQEKLATILSYHVVPGKVTSDMLKTGEVETVAGADLTVMAADEQPDIITVDGATVINPDIEASNGVIHVIDTVLIPEG